MSNVNSARKKVRGVFVSKPTPPADSLIFLCAVRDSNPRHFECKSNALPTELTAQMFTVYNNWVLIKQSNLDSIHIQYICFISMKSEEKMAAIALRKEGGSIKEIARKLQVAQASVSVWVRDVELTSEQRSMLTARGFSVDAVEKRRINRIASTRKRHQKIMEEAAKDIRALSRRDLWLIGVALYWGEGGKTNQGSARLSNSDPHVILIMMRFFKEICRVPGEKFRGHVHTFSHLNTTKAENYWAEISGIPKEQFYKSYVKKSAASKDKRETLPYGTFQIYVSDTHLFLKIMGWIEKIKEFGIPRL